MSMNTQLNEVPVDGKGKSDAFHKLNLSDCKKRIIAHIESQLNSERFKG